MNKKSSLSSLYLSFYSCNIIIPFLVSSSDLAQKEKKESMGDIYIVRIRSFSIISSRHILIARTVIWLYLTTRVSGEVNVFAGHIITKTKIKVLLIKKW